MNTQTSTAAGRFEIKAWSPDPDRAALRFDYACDRYGAFTETVRFPVDGAAFARAVDAHGALIDLIAIALGVSYYKAGACGRIVLQRPPAPAGLALARALYTEGLGEFYVHNKLPYPPALTFTNSAGAELASFEPVGTPPSYGAGGRRAIVAFGGGKDSHVALSLVERAGVSATLASVALSDPVGARIQTCTDRRVEIVARRIDPRLVEANRAGALNGHVPITAINSLILEFYGAIVGADWVVFANERSADEATVTVAGHGINHQYSKTLAAEKLLASAIAAGAARAPAYFSALRPMSELWIARELVRLPDALARFCSCNRNFSFVREDASQTHWCGSCAKCIFTIIITAPFMSRAQSVALFGADALNAPGARVHAKEMAGLAAQKPWDCVGTIEEVRAALSYLLDRPDWRGALIVRELGGALREQFGAPALARAFEAALTPEGASLAPPELAPLSR